MADPPRPPARSNAEQARQAINSGATGDKTAGFDPAAAPLGADDEAAGTPLHASDWAREVDQQSRGLKQPRGASPEKTPDARASPSHEGLTVTMYGALALLAILAVVATLIWVAR